MHEGHVEAERYFPVAQAVQEVDVPEHYAQLTSHYEHEELDK